MEHAHNSVPPGVVGAGNDLGAAVDRLDQALATLESRILALQAQGTIPPAPTLLDGVDPEAMMAEIKVLQTREQTLVAAAEGAFAALGVAAADIRQIVKEQAA